MIFPHINTADENGILAVGGSINNEFLLEAYTNGIFPWPDDDQLIWFAPPKRAVLFLDQYTISKSLKKLIKNHTYQVKINSDLEKIISNCSKNVNRTDTWINQEIIKGFINFSKLGFVLSISIYEEDQLIGGLYGVKINNFFAGESMFYLKPNASKLAFYYLVKFLKKEKITWIDCQVQNKFLKTLGSKEISRDDYMKLLKLTTCFNNL